MSVLAERVKALREEKRLNQSELATASSVAQATISRIESGTRGANTEILRSLADALETSMDYLVGRTDEAVARHYSSLSVSDPIAQHLWWCFEVLSLENRSSLASFADFLVLQEKLGPDTRKLSAVSPEALTSLLASSSSAQDPYGGGLR